MNIHIVVTLATLFFGFGYAYGESRRLSIVKVLMTLIVVAPFSFQIYLAYEIEYFVLIIVSLIIGFRIGWAKELQIGISPSFFDRMVPDFNFARFFHHRQEESHQKERAEREDQADIERERKRRADEMKKEREQASGKAQAHKETEKSQEEGTRQKESRPPKKPPEPDDNRTPEEILGLKAGWTKDDLKKAYREKSKKVHPDNWNGMPIKLQKEMEEEQKRVNEAYQLLLRENK